MTQRAKVGFCPCCASPTHFAAPSRYWVGEYSPRKAHGIQSRRERGPWAVRYFAGALYVRDSGYLPSAWDWAIQSLALNPQRYMAASSVPRAKRIPQFAIRPPKKQWGVIPNPLFSCSRLFPTYRVKLRTVAAAF